MTRFTKTLVALTSIAAAVATTSTTAHAGDTFKASFNYDKAASAEVNLDSFKKTASTICTQQLVEAGFRKTDTTLIWQRPLPFREGPFLQSNLLVSKLFRTAILA